MYICQNEYKVLRLQVSKGFSLLTKLRFSLMEFVLSSHTITTNILTKF